MILIEEVRPDLVIEIGTHLGGGLYIADIMDRIGRVMVHTIDLAPKEYI